MRKAFRYSSSFALWLAVAAIWAHMIIPHDHHLGGSFSGEDLKCPASHQEQGHKSEIPVHCHAFNDLASEKARFFHFDHHISNIAGVVAILQDHPVCDPCLIGAIIPDDQTPDIDPYSGEPVLQRAPPISA